MEFLDVNKYEIDILSLIVRQLVSIKQYSLMLDIKVSDVLKDYKYLPVYDEDALHDMSMFYYNYVQDSFILQLLMYIFGEDNVYIEEYSYEELSVMDHKFLFDLFNRLVDEVAYDISYLTSEFQYENEEDILDFDMNSIFVKCVEDIDKMDKKTFCIFCSFVSYLYMYECSCPCCLLTIKLNKTDKYDYNDLSQKIINALDPLAYKTIDCEKYIESQLAIKDLIYAFEVYFLTEEYTHIQELCKTIKEIGVENIEK